MLGDHWVHGPGFLRVANIRLACPLLDRDLYYLLFFRWGLVYPTSSIVLLCTDTISVSGIATSAAIGFVPHFEDFQKFRIPVILWLLSAACGDIAITVTMVKYLVRLSTCQFGSLLKLSSVNIGPGICRLTRRSTKSFDVRQLCFIGRC